MALRITPLIIACLLLAAHFLRRGDLVLVAISAAAPLLLLVRARWVLWVLQALAYCGALLWVWTAFEFAQHRIALGVPWVRMAVIVGGVAAFTAIAGALLNTRALRRRYPVDNPTSEEPQP